MNDYVKPETRKARFLAAGPILAGHFRLDDLTPATVCAAAQLGEQDFAEEFGTVGDYVAELHRRFLDGLLARMIQEAGDLKPGIERILRSSFAQLDACLEQRALRAWFSEGRRKLPRVAEEIHQRNRGTAMMISIELSELGCREPMIIARFYSTMMLEAAQMEADAGREVPEVRQALRDFLLSWILARGSAPISRPVAA